ncbi:hypothetical protein Tco_0078972 [Tanacetum coccineum]
MCMTEDSKSYLITGCKLLGESDLKPRSDFLEVGVSVVAKKYDLSAGSPLQTSDILNLQPVVKHSIPVCQEAKELIETEKVQLAEGMLNEAYNLFTGAFTILQQVTGLMHREVANCCRYLAMVVYHARDMAATIIQQHEELIINERCLGPRPTQHQLTRYYPGRDCFGNRKQNCSEVTECKEKDIIVTTKAAKVSNQKANFVMSDSEDSTITYTEVSCPFEDLSDIGSPRVIIHGYDGLPMMSEDAYAYVEAAMQEPPSQDFVSEPAYLEFIPPEDDVFLAEEHPLPAVASPTADSPGYISESDPEEDPKEDDEDPQEDPADYPTDRDNEEEEEESFGDDADDEEEDKDEDEEEDEEHLASADSVPPPTYRSTARMSIRDQTPIPFPSEAEGDRLLAISTPPPYPLTSYLSPLPQIPSSPLPVSSPLPMSPPLLPISPTHPLGYRAAVIRFRAESPSTSHPLPLPLPIVLPYTRASMAMMRATTPSTYILAPRSETPPSGTPPLLPIPLPTSSPPLFLPSTDCRVDVLEVTLPPQKRLCIALDPRYEVGECSSAPTARPTRGFRADYGFVGTLDAEIRRDPNREIGYGITDIWVDPDEITKELPATDVAELGQRMTDFVTTVRQYTNKIYGRLDDAQDDRLLMSGQLNLLRRDRRSHARTTILMKGEARASREAWTLMAALQSQQRPARDLAHPDVPEEAGSSS